MDTASFPKNYLFSGDYSIGETPVPISNTEVKPYCADGTALETGWESRSLPGIIHKTPELTFRGFIFWMYKNEFGCNLLYHLIKLVERDRKKCTIKTE